MRVERRPFAFELRAEFPNACRFQVWEGGGAFRAERGGTPVIVIDERTLADFLDEADSQDAGALDALVSVLEFETEAQREAYIAQEMALGAHRNDDQVITK
jgi:hypothetical protein